MSYHKSNNESKNSAEIVIGWTGSETTIRHFRMAIPWLIKLKNRYGNRIGFTVISNKALEDSKLETNFVQWNKESEIEDLCKMDIGIMPLPDNEWSKGKCGFKALQYMALEIPVVVSPVGMNKELVSDSVNGFIAGTEDEWIHKLSQLIESEPWRKKFGIEGRKTVEKNFSVEANLPKYLQIFQDILTLNDFANKNH